jgi:uncharacterized protein
MKKRIIFFLLFIAFSSGFAQDLPDRKAPLVNDFADVLTDKEEALLERKLEAYNQSASATIELVTISRLEYYDVNEYAEMLAKKWRLDKRGVTILLLADIQDRRYGIFKTKEMSTLITDDIAIRIEDKFIKPNFRDELYFDGLDQASNTIMDIVSGRYKPEDLKTDHSGNLFIIIFFLFLFLFIFFPAMQYKSLKKAHIGTKDMSFTTKLILMNSFGAPSKAGYDDFTKSKGKFAGRAYGGFVSGGGGATGTW